MQKYRIWVEIRGGYYTTIEAENFNEAIDIAIKNADPYNVQDWDYDAMEG